MPKVRTPYRVCGTNSELCRTRSALGRIAGRNLLKYARGTSLSKDVFSRLNLCVLFPSRKSSFNRESSRFIG